MSMSVDKFMEALSAKVRGFFAWWGNLTGTKTVHKDDRFWNWPTITFIVFSWIVLGIGVYFNYYR